MFLSLLSLCPSPLLSLTRALSLTCLWCCVVFLSLLALRSSHAPLPCSHVPSAAISSFSLLVRAHQPLLSASPGCTTAPSRPDASRLLIASRRAPLYVPHFRHQSSWRGQLLNVLRWSQGDSLSSSSSGSVRSEEAIPAGMMMIWCWYRSFVTHASRLAYSILISCVFVLLLHM